MLNTIESVYAILLAIVAGISVSVIYTNTSRTAISRFILGLIDKGAFSMDNAVTLKKLNINSLHSKIINSAVKSQNGLKRIIEYIKIDAPQKDEAEILISGNKIEYKYFLTDNVDIEQIKKKYSYKTVGPIKVILLVLLIALAALFAVKAVDIFDSYVSSKNSPKNEENLDLKENQKLPFEEDNIDYSNGIDNNTTDGKEDEDKSSIPSKPTIPTGPPQKN